MPAVSAVVGELDPELELARLRTLDELVSRSVSEPRFYMVLLGGFAGLALLLAALGIFGVLSYAVAQRSREIGIRLALGARPGQVLRQVLARGLFQTGVGVVLGLAAAGLSTSLLVSLRYQVEPTDFGTLATAAAVLLAASLVASYAPARRAAAIDPAAILARE